jgi:hypothetical protein
MLKSIDDVFILKCNIKFIIFTFSIILHSFFNHYHLDVRSKENYIDFKLLFAITIISNNILVMITKNIIISIIIVI